MGYVDIQDSGPRWGSWSLDLYLGPVWKEIPLFSCCWSTSFPSKVFNHLICVKEHRLFISSCASTEDASLLMNPGLETSPLCVWGHESPGRGQDLRVHQEIGSKGRTEHGDETTRRSHCIVLNPVPKFRSFKRIITCLFELL